MYIHRMLNQFKYQLLFVALLVGVFFYYHFDEILFKRPTSVHYWRQADCASLALNYYQGRMDFLHPEVHNLTSDNFTTGYTCTSEMPLLYYSVAILYRIFGYHEFLYRLLNVLIFFIGLFYLYKLFYNLLKHQFWAMCLPLLLFSSPVLAYYSNNFLSNSTALGVVFIAWYHFMEFCRTKDTKYFRRSVLFFTIAGLLKITALLSLAAIIAVFILEKLKAEERNRMFPISWRNLWLFVFSIAVIGAWTTYAAYYNKEHATSYFSTTIFPIWEMSGEEIAAVKNGIFKLWFGQYYNEALWSFWFLCTLAIVILQKRGNKFLMMVSSLIFLCTCAFIALQFAALKDHDYYTINLFILPVVILITLFDLLRTHFRSVLQSKIAMTVVFAFTFFNVNYAMTEINNRYYGWWNHDGIKNDIEDITPYLRSIGVDRTDAIISIPDKSHLSLYLMNQKGWTEYSEWSFENDVPISLNTEREGMESAIGNGAKYLVINGLDQLFMRPFLYEYAVHLAGQFRNVLIFDLSKRDERNFVLPNRRVKEILVCNTEILAPNGKKYSSLYGDYVFGSVETRSTDYAFSGNTSVKLNTEHEQGMSVTIENVRHGESYIVSVMRKKGGSAGDLVAVGKGKPRYSVSENELSSSNDSEWEMLTMEFHIPPKMNGRPLFIYVRNQAAEPTYFDDLKIVRFQSYFKN
ncbi:MAG TPA: hypothetical protein EYN71_04135 [Flavobacteriales bacterium]|nr:hypothetical protein [Flavobacteriales bacterium]